MALLFLAGMLFFTYVCEGALIRKSSASDFLQTNRERRDVECYFGDCSRESSEVEETLGTGTDYEEISDLSYEGDIEQNGNEDQSNLLYDVYGEETEHEETFDVPDTGTAVYVQANEQILLHVETDILVNDHSAQELDGSDGQKVQQDGLEDADGSGM